jgi:hypothetical protein
VRINIRSKVAVVDVTNVAGYRPEILGIKNRKSLCGHTKNKKVENVVGFLFVKLKKKKKNSKLLRIRHNG